MPHVNKQMISFFLTTKCNLCCRYCYNAKERAKIEEQTLEVSIAKSAIEYYFESNESRHIRFYGPGEPTQEFEKLKEITEYAKKVGGQKVTVEIQTNGIFDNNIRAWMLKNMNIIWMSFDGPPDIQNYNRPLNPQFKDCDNKTSAEIMEDNVKWLIQNDTNGSLMVGARVTMSDVNIERQIEMVDYFYNLGIRYVWTNPLFYAVDKKPVCEDFDKQKVYKFDMEKYLHNYVLAYKYAKDKDLFWGSFLAANFDGNSSFNCRACTPVPHVTPDGYISACDMVVLGENAHHMDCLVYGKWNSASKTFSFDKNKIKKLQERSSTSEDLLHCHGCSAQFHCGGYCLGEVVNETGKLNGIPRNCEAVRYLLNELGTTEPYKYLHP